MKTASQMKTASEPQSFMEGIRKNTRGLRTVAAEIRISDTGTLYPVASQQACADHFSRILLALRIVLSDILSSKPARPLLESPNVAGIFLSAQGGVT